MSISSNKQQKKGKDGTGKAGKRKEMVKDWSEVSCMWKSKLYVAASKPRRIGHYARSNRPIAIYCNIYVDKLCVDKSRAKCAWTNCV